MQSQLDKPLDKTAIHIGPSDHVPWLEDRKWAMIRLEGRNFGDVPLSDRDEARGVGLTELRRHRDRRGALREARDGPRMGGPLIGPSAYFMKSPPVQFSDEAAHDMVESFILGNGKPPRPDWTRVLRRPVRRGVTTG